MTRLNIALDIDLPHMFTDARQSSTLCFAIYSHDRLLLLIKYKFQVSNIIYVRKLRFKVLNFSSNAVSLIKSSYSVQKAAIQSVQTLLGAYSVYFTKRNIVLFCLVLTSLSLVAYFVTNIIS